MRASELPADRDQRAAMLFVQVAARAKVDYIRHGRMHDSEKSSFYKHLARAAGLDVTGG